MALTVSEPIHKLCQELELSDEQLQKMSSLFLDDIKAGLAKKTHKKASVKCFITYVQDLPNGKETGDFLALDLGGTNFRVLLVSLAEGKCDMQSKIYAIPKELMTGKGATLFDHIADCLLDFVSEHDLTGKMMPLGFTFSFPLSQKGLDSGHLEKWTKGFKIPDAVNKDVVQLLKAAIERKGGIKIEVYAVLNDTTGTLMSCAWKNQDCKVGLIIGTGTNSCYVEKVENCEMFEGDPSKPYVIVNTESGAFGDDGKLKFLRTEYDKIVDKKSINAGKQLNEKMISGMYMGELVRLVLIAAAKKKIMFGGKASKKLNTKDAFLTKFVSDIESDAPGSYEQVKIVLDELDMTEATDQDYEDTRYICHCFSTRAAQMVSATMATLINKMGFNPVTVGIDGTLYRCHPQFHNVMMDTMKKLVNPEIKFELMLSEDGSGRGAALVAAVQERLKGT